MQKRFWEEVAKVRREYERMIHEELRIIRQRGLATGAALRRHRRSGCLIRAAASGRVRLRPVRRAFSRLAKSTSRRIMQFYLPKFEGRGPVLDIGCGRGEFLEMMRDAGVEARGIDLSEESVARCRAEGLAGGAGRSVRLSARSARPSLGRHLLRSGDRASAARQSAAR